MQILGSNTMEQSPWEANGGSVTQEMFLLLENSKSRYRVPTTEVR
jgi:environmental stress-induced protein Ves